MAALDRIALPGRSDLPAMWAVGADAARCWMRERGVAERDAVLLVPYAALLKPARDAFAASGSIWMPRIETPLTLAASLGPPPAVRPGQLSGSNLIDTLQAAQRLAGLPGVLPELLDHAAGLVVRAAQALRDGARARAPHEREAYWSTARARAAAAAAGAAGPVGLEGRLLREAVEWACGGAPAETDRLFELRPAAWIVLRIGGPDALAESLLRSGEGPGLLLDADPPADAPFAAPGPAALQRWICPDAEAEARAAASALIAAVSEASGPVALVAVDREGVRRTRALLERAGLAVSDETGWRLATTRGAARVIGVLRAAAAVAGAPGAPGAIGARDVRHGPGPREDADDVLAWLATWPRADATALRSLEAAWRRRRRVPDRAAAERLQAAAARHLGAFSAGPPRRSLADWIALLADRLRDDGSLAELQADAAGRQVLAALTIDMSGIPAAVAPSLLPAWRAAAAARRLDLAGFIAWAESTLDSAPYEPQRDAEAGPGTVVLTPLARAIGRRFAHVVLPGADHLHLGAAASEPGLIGDALARELGLESAHTRRLRQRAALAQLLRVPALTLIRRHRDADEALADSPDVAWLLLERLRRGLPACPPAPPPLHQAELQGAPVAPPAPRAEAALPEALSASQVGALRECPYRFFARAVLRLDEAAELGQPLAKRDYGDWLHLALHRFHSARREGQDDAEALQHAAREATAELALDEGELLPYRASFEVFAPAYLAWLHRREAEGWRWAAGEADYRVAPPELAPTALCGRVDRLDQGPGPWQQLIDYKTGPAKKFQELTSNPLEDTQLAFYAALLGASPQVSAAYLAVDGAGAPREFEHPAVHRSARALIEGLGGELARIRAGAPLPPLGEGSVCGYCEARGLCRRDHWTRA
jgi:ATP-dependent helicase/nuclease subunit B